MHNFHFGNCFIFNKYAGMARVFQLVQGPTMVLNKSSFATRDNFTAYIRASRLTSRYHYGSWLSSWWTEQQVPDHSRSVICIREANRRARCCLVVTLTNQRCLVSRVILHKTKRNPCCVKFLFVDRLCPKYPAILPSCSSPQWRDVLCILIRYWY